MKLLNCSALHAASLAASAIAGVGEECVGTSQ